MYSNVYVHEMVREDKRVGARIFSFANRDKSRIVFMIDKRLSKDGEMSLGDITVSGRTVGFRREAPVQPDQH